ncbi:unnamed protein product [marine sediment metagenome]|uniref:Uncharacterized protein n=1 Tax=marine sediment metagenome TaxID=412755 RepID=X1NDR1_9ZZZZ
MYFEDQDYPRAEQQLLKAIHLNPKYAEAYNLLGNLYYRLFYQAEVFDKDRQAAEKYWKRAYNCYQEVRKLKPDFPDPCIGLALLYIDIEEFDKAINLLMKARQSRPDDPWLEAVVHYHLGRCYNAKRQYPEALKEFNAYLRLSPEGPEADAVRMALRLIERKLKKSPE